MDTTKQIIDYLNQLAAQLKVPTEELWAALMRQVYINSWCNICLMLFGIILIIVAATCAKKIKNDDIALGFILIAMSASVLTILFIITDLSITIAGFANPQYAAVKLLMQNVGH